MPKLIYIKTRDNREERLKELIARIQTDDTAAYLPFADCRGIGEPGRRRPGHAAGRAVRRVPHGRRGAEPGCLGRLVARVPVPYTTTIGREREIGEVRELLARGSDRVVSLIGPGGIGKSRLAIEVAIAARDLFPDGTYFVGLENVLEPALLLPTIAYTLGIRDNGEAALEERISHALAGRRVLLVLDNFEQIVEAAPVLVRLYTVAPTASFLVTSRIVLRIRGEQVYDVRGADDARSRRPRRRWSALTQSAAVALFVDRASAAKPGFELTEENVGAVMDICRRLEGLPLAIELAAAKVRMLTPAGVAERLKQQPAAADRRRPRPAGPAPHDAGDAGLERRACSPAGARSARGPRRVRRAVLAGGGRGDRRRPGVGRARRSTGSRRSSTARS